MMAEATTLRLVELNLWPKKSGMVALFIKCVIRRVRLPKILHAKRDPINALPMPTHVAESPYFQPNCPAYPTNITAEKYDVPNAKAVSHDPTFLSPNTNP